MYDSKMTAEGDCEHAKTLDAICMRLSRFHSFQLGDKKIDRENCLLWVERLVRRAWGNFRVLPIISASDHSLLCEISRVLQRAARLALGSDDQRLLERAADSVQQIANRYCGNDYPNDPGDMDKGPEVPVFDDAHDLGVAFSVAPSKGAGIYFQSRLGVFDFAWALRQLQKGYRVKRRCWPAGHYAVMEGGRPSISFYEGDVCKHVYTLFNLPGTLFQTDGWRADGFHGSEGEDS